MKENARFRNEYDTVDTVTVRNISEKRRLDKQLRLLDKQLHNNLVRMKTDMLSIRLDNRPREVSSLTAKSALGEKKPVHNDTRKGAEADVKLHREKMVPHGIKLVVTDCQSSRQRSWSTNSSNLPQITPANNKENHCHSLNATRSPREPLSRSQLKEKHLGVEKRILGSLYRPRSATNLVEPWAPADRRSPTPRAQKDIAAKAMTSREKGRNDLWGSVQRNLLFPSTGQISANSTFARSRSSSDVTNKDAVAMGMPRERTRAREGSWGVATKDLLSPRPGSSLHRSRSTSDIDENSWSGFENETLEITNTRHGNGSEAEEPTASDEGVSSEEDVKAPPPNYFDEVAKARLELFKDGLPAKSEMMKIRYLRGNSPRQDEQNILSVFDD